MSASASAELLELAAAGRHDELRRAAGALAPVDFAALVEQLAANSAAAALAALDAPELPRDARKAVRRASHALRTHGLHVPEAARVGRLAGLAAPEAAAEFRAEAWLSLPRPAVELVLVARTHADRHLFVALLDEEERVLEGGAVGNASRQGVRDLLDRQSRGGEPFVPFDAGHVAARLRAAAARPPSPHGSKAGMARAEIAERLPACDALADAPHPALALAPDDPSEQDAQADFVAGHLGPRDLPFALDEKVVQELLARLNTARESPLVLVPGARDRREDQVLEAFVDGELPAATRETLGLRYLDRAWTSARKRDEVGARAAAACGSLLLHRPDAASTRALLRAFVAAHLAPPDERSDGASERPERRSPGGIILP